MEGVMSIGVGLSPFDVWKALFMKYPYEEVEKLHEEIVKEGKKRYIASHPPDIIVVGADEVSLEEVVKNAEKEKKKRQAEKDRKE
jgi:hypothetical protein